MNIMHFDGESKVTSEECHWSHFCRNLVGLGISLSFFFFKSVFPLMLIKLFKK